MSSPRRFSSFSLRSPFAHGVLVDRVREGLLEALLVHTALGRCNVVRERMDALVVARVPLHRDVDLGVVALVLERGNPLEQRLLGGVEVLDEVDDSARVLEHLLERGVGSIIAEADLEPGVEERHLPEALDQGLRSEAGVLEDRGVRPEGDDRARALRGRLLDELARRGAAVGERHLPAPAVAVDLELEPGRERVHDRDADAVQPAGDLVPLTSELAAGVQRREHELRSRLLGLRMVVDRDPSAVVRHPAAAVGEERHVDARRETGHRLVDRVVHHLVHEMVQTRETRGADVHAGTFADRFETLEDRDVFRRVRHARAPRRPSGDLLAGLCAGLREHPSGPGVRTGGSRTASRGISGKTPGQST